MMRNVLALSTCLVIALSLACSKSAQKAGSDGERLFSELKCVTCHAVRGTGGKVGPELGAKAEQPYTPNVMASAMWSHAAKMWQAMDQAGVQRPQVTAQQAEALYSYIAGSPSPASPGDPKEGQRVYQAKFCASCHDEPTSGAPNLAAQAGNFSSFSMVASLWQHGAGMLSRMTSNNKDWQQLSPEEMSHLIAFLNSKR